MKKIAISGVTGFIGSHLCYEFLKKGYKVIGIGREENDRIKNLNNKNFTFINIDKIDKENLKNVDIFYHLAWNKKYAGTKDNTLAYNIEIENLEMTCKLIDCAIKCGVKKIVFVGTIIQEKYYCDENNQLTNIKGRIHGIIKTAANDVCQKLADTAKIQYNQVLLGHTYGPGDAYSILSFIKKIYNNQDLDLISDNDLADWVYIDDIINALVVVGEKGHNMKTYYVGHRKLNTFGSYIKQVKNILHSKSNLNFGKYQEFDKTDYSHIDLDALYNDTKFECTCDFKESIEKTIDWLKEEGHLNE